jgi:hypothetical protein
MLTNPSSKWLSSRLAARQLADAASANLPSRPCLPAIEPLDDRLMLSATPSPFYQSGGHEGITVDPKILIGLIKGQLNLVQDELTALKIAPGQMKLADLVQMKVDWLNMDDAITRLGEDAIAGNLTDYKEQKMLTSIDDIFIKLQSIIPPSPIDGGNNLLLPAVQKVREAALKIVMDFAAPTDGGSNVTDKQQNAILAIPDQFLNMDELLMKYGQNPAAPEFATGFAPDMKVEETFVKIDFLVSQLDPNLQLHLKQIITQMKVDTLTFLGTLNNQPPVDTTGGGGTFTGGIVLTDTGDILS